MKTVETTEKLKTSSLAQLARAWCELEERKRILRGKPLPKSVAVQPKSANASRLLQRSAGKPLFEDPTQAPPQKEKESL